MWKKSGVCARFFFTQKTSIRVFIFPIEIFACGDIIKGRTLFLEFLLNHGRRLHSHYDISFGGSPRRPCFGGNDIFLYMIREKVPLARMTTMNVGGDARYFLSVASDEGVRRAIGFAREKKVPLFVLGGGSNTVFGDNGFDGMVVRMEIKGVSFFDKGDTVRVVAGAGEEWDALVATTVSRGLHGLENLSLIPGTVGGAPVQNIGAYGREVSSTLAWVEAIDRESGALVRIKNYECLFGYRRSVFQAKEGSRYIIVRVAFDLPKHAPLAMEYDDVRAYFARTGVAPTLASVRDAIVDIRKGKLPDVRVIGTAGSFFKNPTVPLSVVEALLKTHPTLRHTPVDAVTTKVSAAWLLDAVCGYKGLRVGSVGVHEKHALVLVHYGGGTASDIRKLSEEMADCVKKKTGIELEREVMFVGV